MKIFKYILLIILLLFTIEHLGAIEYTAASLQALYNAGNAGRESFDILAQKTPLVRDLGENGQWVARYIILHTQDPRNAKLVEQINATQNSPSNTPSLLGYATKFAIGAFALGTVGIGAYSLGRLSLKKDLDEQKKLIEAQKTKLDNQHEKLKLMKNFIREYAPTIEELNRETQKIPLKNEILSFNTVFSFGSSFAVSFFKAALEKRLPTPQELSQAGVGFLIERLLGIVPKRIAQEVFEEKNPLMVLKTDIYAWSQANNVTNYVNSFLKKRFE